MPETVDIFKNKKTGLFLLQKKCTDPVLKGPTSVGEPEILSSADLSQQGVRKILDALDSSSKPCSDQAQIRRRSEEEYRRFCNLHHCVTVARWPSGTGEIELYPLRRVRRGYRSIKDGKIVLPADQVQHRLLNAVLLAFQQIEEENR